MPDVNDGSESREAEGKLSELRSVVAYLRKEKDIVDLQLELSKQESARFKAQTEQLSKSLDEVRLTLSMVCITVKADRMKFLHVSKLRKERKLQMLCNNRLSTTSLWRK